MRLQEVAGCYKGLRVLQDVTGGYQEIQGFTEGYNRLQGLQGVTRVYIGLLEVSRG